MSDNCWPDDWPIEAISIPEEIATLRKRIEELERLNAAEQHIITDDKIDAAWENWANNKELRPYSRKAAELCLAECGIVRCEYENCQDGYVWDKKCPDCDGHGWRKDD